MRTVPTLCASGASLSLSAIGLTLARPDDQPHAHEGQETPDAKTKLRPGGHTAAQLISRRLADGHARRTTSFAAAPSVQQHVHVTRLEPPAHLPSGVGGRLPFQRLRGLLPLGVHDADVSRAHIRPPAAQQADQAVRLAAQLQWLAPRRRRLATASAGRSATLQDRLSGAEQTDDMSLEQFSRGTREPEWRQYFTPRVEADGMMGRRRSSTGIPNPIKRIYPDRKYTPILVSAREPVKPAQVEVDDGLSLREEADMTRLNLSPTALSSPLPAQPPHFDTMPEPKRSFSIGDLLSTGPQPLWRRPSVSRSKGSASLLSRKARSRVASAPQASLMGIGFSSPTAPESGRPAKRRDITDPEVVRRSIYSSSSSIHPLEVPPHECHPNASSNTPQSLQFSFSESPSAETPLRLPTPPPLDPRRPPSSNAESAIRPGRISATQSEITSTVGSDSERRSIGGYSSTDNQSDTVYDSFPTRTTRSSSGKRGPPIDTIFDESPPTFSSGRSTRLGDLLDNGHFPGSGHGGRYRHSTIEEEESLVSTPVRSMHDKSVTSTPSARRGVPQQLFNSSPPTMTIMPDPDDMDWDAPDDSHNFMHGLGIGPSLTIFPSNLTPPTALPLHMTSALTRPINGASAHSTPLRHGNGGTERANLFDWSEQQPSPSHHDQSPPRPRTVHGKKDPESRGSRSTGRRAPSSMHARSHSVPVVPDVEGKRSVVANKFGTWGVGSKGVTEDWNDDFDFGEPTPVSARELADGDGRRIDSGHEMFVPVSIREQQQSVVANIELLKEWGLLIEELKDLRIRAVALDILHGPYAQAWKEVDAMIELADQESDEKTLQPRRSPPSSPSFDYGAFDEPAASPTPAAARSRDAPPTTSRSLEFDLDDPQDPPEDTAITSAPPPVANGRPRKDSEAVARSVIEALQAKRNFFDPTATTVNTFAAASTSKKVPFDTATLRHIVPYVKGLKRKVKDALRETEALYSSPRRRSLP
ncbi:hypothetical protein M433DRAFT_48363, partial [Acidomyces richmondensis BFW]